MSLTYWVVTMFDVVRVIGESLVTLIVSGWVIVSIFDTLAWFGDNQDGIFRATDDSTTRTTQQ